jgi:hypothetical protein
VHKPVFREYPGILPLPSYSSALWTCRRLLGFPRPYTGSKNTFQGKYLLIITY